MITVRYSSIDHFHKTRSFKTLAAAKKFATHYVGEFPEFGSSYAVSFDGVGKITVTGCTLKELFAGKLEPAPGSLPFEVWSYFIDEDRGTSRKVKDGAFATLYEANQCIDQLERHVDGLHIVATNPEAEAELSAQNEREREMLMRSTDHFIQPTRGEEL